MYLYYIVYVSLHVHLGYIMIYAHFIPTQPAISTGPFWRSQGDVSSDNLPQQL